ncbi:SidA/IucD/PvdA family monooxygenase [Massilia sp. YIM B04103]|uniref:SidA/IucD/PvdA family monooxygenase n=1 Tax=Massilia sp. YIM B04103 TaxID=2963106 RepID=UPI00210E72BE|nr:SidA/IucD/PvdA family monooxygenase [Massilia sp. YIM B04103]
MSGSIHNTSGPHELEVAAAGFGPAGIALACAIADHAEENGRQAFAGVRFFERAKNTAWHGDFLLSGTDINHHLLRDLVTPRNPRSRFSFAMYLKEKGRLFKFGLLGRPASRVEWSDYIAWASAQLTDYVAYDEGVLEVLPHTEDGKLRAVDVITAHGSYRTRRLVLSNGSLPRIPQVFQPHLGDGVFHTSDYLKKVSLGSGPLPQRWLVVGSGQSAGEAVAHLLGRAPTTHVHSVHGGVGFRVGQQGQFPNLAFLPEQVDYFHHLDPAARTRVFDDIRSTNYAGVDADESQALYSVLYEGEVTGQRRYEPHAWSAVEAVEALGKAYAVTLRDSNTGKTSTIVVDAIVLGTGYEQPPIPPLLAMLQPWLERDADGSMMVDRQYRVGLRHAQGIAIFANGTSEKTHGISDAQSFSMVAVRAQALLEGLLAAQRETGLRSAQAA